MQLCSWDRYSCLFYIQSYRKERSNCTRKMARLLGWCVLHLNFFTKFCILFFLWFLFGVVFILAVYGSFTVAEVFADKILSWYVFLLHFAYLWYMSNILKVLNFSYISVLIGLLQGSLVLSCKACFSYLASVASQLCMSQNI